MIPMYDELIKRLRECTAEQNGEKTLWHQAADAIEDLDNRLNLHRQGKIRHWIPVTERLPLGNNLVFAVANGEVVIAIYGNYKWADAKTYAEFYPTHWMPLPEPPKEET